MAGDKLEFRGPIGGYFTWEAKDGGPLFLVGGGSGVVPLMAMLRHRAAVGSEVSTRLLYSSRSYEEIIYREELERLAAGDGSLEVIHTLIRSRPQSWSGYHRRIDAEMLAEVGWPPHESLSSSCAVPRRSGYSWKRVASDYNSPEGGLLPLGLAALAASPYIAGKVRGLV